MNYCPFCGAPVNSEMLFCPSCGKKLSQQEYNSNTENLRLGNKSAGNVSGLSKRQINNSLLTKILPFIVIISIAVCGLFIWRTRDFTRSPKRINRAVESAVKVISFDLYGNVLCEGSGFCLFNDSIIITNYHVIDGALSVKISTDEDFTYEIESVINFDANKDIAILKSKDSVGIPHLSVGNSQSSRKGDAVVAIGSPLGNKNSVSVGVLSGRWYNYASGVDEIQFSAAISHGSSGGALLDKRGKVIGVTSSTFIEGQNMNLAVPIEEVERLYNNRSTEISFEDVFESVYTKRTALNYFSSELVDFNELLRNPTDYDGGIIISTYAYIETMRDESGHETIIAVSDASEMGMVTDTNSIICIPRMNTQSISAEISGKVLLCGRLFYHEGGWVKEAGRMIVKATEHDLGAYYDPYRYEMAVYYVG